MRNIMNVKILLASVVPLPGCDRQERRSNHFHSDSQPSTQEIVSGELKLPFFELLSAKNGSSKNSSDFDAKMLLFAFFSRWYGTCREETIKRPKCWSCTIMARCTIRKWCSSNIQEGLKDEKSICYRSGNDPL